MAFLEQSKNVITVKGRHLVLVITNNWPSSTCVCLAEDLAVTGDIFIISYSLNSRREKNGINYSTMSSKEKIPVPVCW